MTVVYRMAQLVSQPPVRNRIILALWLAVAAAVAVRVPVMLNNPVLPGESFRGAEGYFLDFRDTIWTPGRFMLGGGNPYDPEAYLAANPWALPFSLYTPAWLLLAVVLAPLPFLVSVLVFQAISVGIAYVMLRVICRWALPGLSDLAIPAGLLWMNIWYPGRGAISVQLGTMLAVLGIALVLRSLTREKLGSGAAAAGPGRPRTVVDRAAALGMAIALIKVQFMAIVFVGLARGRHREAWWGVGGLALLSMPVVIACSVAAGGPVEFVRSVLRDIAVLTSNVGPTGLTFPGQQRFDLVGQLARYGLTHPPLWVTIGVPLLALAAALIAVRRSRNPLVLSAAVSTSILIGFYHGRYDVILLLIPVAVGVGMAVRGEITSIAEWITVGSLFLVVVHLHTITKTLTSLGVREAATIDLGLIVIGFASAMYSALSTRERPPVPA